MELRVWYWLFLVLAIIFGGWHAYAPHPRLVYGSSVVTFILFVLLGIHLFGSPLK